MTRLQATVYGRILEGIGLLLMLKLEMVKETDVLRYLSECAMLRGRLDATRCEDDET